MTSPGSSRPRHFEGSSSPLRLLRPGAPAAPPARPAGPSSRRSLMIEALRLTNRAEMLMGGQAEPDLYAALIHGQWLMRNGKSAAAQKVLTRVRNEAKSEALKEAARLSADAPQPLASAPPLFTFNTIGTGLYGRRDV